MNALENDAAEPSPYEPYRRGDLRAAFVRGALVMVRERGEDRFSLNELARRIGVSPAAAYRHFANKQALLAAVCATGYDGLRAALGEATAEPAAAGDRLLDVGVRYVRFATSNPDLFAMMFGRLAVDADAVGADTFVPLLDAVAAAQAERLLPAHEPARLARALWTMLHGIAVLHLSGGRAALGLDDDPAELVRDALTVAFPRL